MNNGKGAVSLTVHPKPDHGTSSEGGVHNL
jgi:hypothetical protein